MGEAVTHEVIKVCHATTASARPCRVLVGSLRGIGHIGVASVHVSNRLFVRNVSYENVFCQHIHPGGGEGGT